MIAKEINISTNQHKQDLINNILITFDIYTKLNIIGTGKEGVIYKVKNGTSFFAMKCFKKNKSINTFKNEASHLELASRINISPKVFKVDLTSKYIIMQLLNKTLFHLLKESGKISISTQKDIVKIFDKLDEIGIFHRDPNPLNLMIDHKGKWYIIDYGFAVPITKTLQRKHNTKNLNRDFMTMGLYLQLKKISPTLRLDYFQKNLNWKIK